MKCLVVGGAGFIGCYVSNMLVELGRTVAALGRAPAGSRWLSEKEENVWGDYKDLSLSARITKRNRRAN